MQRNCHKCDKRTAALNMRQENATLLGKNGTEVQKIIDWDISGAP